MSEVIEVIGNAGVQRDLLIPQGGTYELPVWIDNPDGGPMDLTGATVRSQIRRKRKDAAVLVEFTVTVINAVGGHLLLSLTDEQTAAIVTGEQPISIESRGVWDLELEDSLGRVLKLLWGTVTFHPEVTR